ncbi:IclR family transcriptional regulator [Streptomyces anulatus]|uniref:IclR family transcriptional regulator n=1 Tax=Streptomyces TaxID=1883 RepID=UPI0006D9AFB9|nr:MULTISPECIES: IclR family transcriptional regulator [Streptomyces]MDF9807978.1 DNA-binding IclR family transcriptional regulator [Streptomyces sp. HB372]KPL29828.1 IclR family transcriptional regulator [Streptomyces anulatus]KQX31164.1 IclR family transcriptional regulator [Streptomyces sp. Root1295]KRA41107.1 IclR family transcriptional regulator [Streptomyces sp. Root63]MBT1100646.1 IclR family transcriptional regulator [Streptomyces sp. Tu10]
MTETAAARAPGGAQAVRRALDVLHCFHDNGPDLSASDLARRLGLPVSTAHRLARTLLAAGFLEQDPRTSRYRLGPAVTELGRLSYHQRGLHLAAPELADLAERTGATADLALRSGPHAVIVAGGSVTPKVGLRRPLHSTALGKVLLAWARPGEGGPGTLPPLPAFTDRTIVDPAALERELERVRTDAYAVNDGESALGVRTLAVPVLDGAGYARFALAVRATPEVITPERTGWLLTEARSCARALEVLLLSPAERRPPAGP